MPKNIKQKNSNFVWGELVVSIFRLNSLFLEIGNEIAKPAGQTSARWAVLASVYSKDQTVAQIARRMGLTRQSVQRIADILSREEFTEYKENMDHKKSKLLSITESGKLAMDLIVREQRRWATLWSKRIKESDLRKTLEMLQRIEEVCQTMKPR